MKQKTDQPKIRYMGQYSEGSSLYRVIVEHLDSDQKLLGTYEIWLTKDFIDLKYPNIKIDLDTKLWESAVAGFEELIKYNENNSKKYSGVFYDKNKFPKYGNYREFPGVLGGIDPTVRTNVSMPESQYRWIRLQAAKENRSISEIVNQIIKNHREITCPKCKGNNTKKTGLSYGLGTGKNIPKNNIKQYECLDCKNLFNFPSN